MFRTRALVTCAVPRHFPFLSLSASKIIPVFFDQSKKLIQGEDIVDIIAHTFLIVSIGPVLAAIFR